MAIVDSNYYYIFIDVGSYSKECDSNIFKETQFWKKLVDNTLNIPSPCSIINTNYILPYVLVADEAFALHANVLRPYGGNELTKEQKIFNYRLTRARRYVDHFVLYAEIHVHTKRTTKTTWLGWLNPTTPPPAAPQQRSPRRATGIRSRTLKSDVKIFGKYVLEHSFSNLEVLRNRIIIFRLHKRVVMLLKSLVETIKNVDNGTLHLVHDHCVVPLHLGILHRNRLANIGQCSKPIYAHIF
ncbi:putative nuclease HARBI1 like protein [Danaus plexippus plexippus]|uniref:Nuclease HARBI1 like protein n=1 Tax=Danaus plexippus plexippus TaxID=278856 RepID=A0A212FJF1_DANPL|nr:putative nuclease HARBI1 like protein [Danaus plexippus plexippus]